MKNVKIYGNFTVMDVFTYNDIIIVTGCDDNGEVFYRFSFFNDDTATNNLDVSQEFYYRSILDLIHDLNETITEIDTTDALDYNTKNHYIYDITMVIKIIEVLYK